MRNLIQQNNLRHGRPAVRAAFSLAEMIVAMGVLVLMLTLAGQVFSLTVQSTGQATALVHLNQALRSFEETVRADLRGVFPGRSVIVIQGNPINTHWTADYVHDPPDPERVAVDATTGAPILDADGFPLRTLPHADLLMMFTNRRGRSFIDPEIQSDLQQVVYGHAEAGEYVRAAGAAPAAPFAFEPAFASGMFPPAFPAGAASEAPFPAQQWHLARRSVQLISMPASELVLSGRALDWMDLFGNTNGDFLADDRLLTGAVDVVVNFDYESLVLHDAMSTGVTGPEHTDPNLDPRWSLPGVFGQSPFQRSKLDTTPPPLYANRLGHYLLPNCASFKVEWSLNPRSDFVAGRLSGAREILWINSGQTNNPVGIPEPEMDDALATIEAKMQSLPNCDPDIDPDCDPLRQQLFQLLNAPARHADGDSYSLTERFRSDRFAGASGVSNPWTPLSMVFNAPSDTRANTHVFTGTRPVLDSTPGSTGAPVSPPEYVPDDVFPSALRITIDVYDPQQRLEKPTRHVIIATIGG